MRTPRRLNEEESVAFAKGDTKIVMPKLSKGWSQVSASEVESSESEKSTTGFKEFDLTDKASMGSKTTCSGEECKDTSCENGECEKSETEDKSKETESEEVEKQIEEMLRLAGCQLNEDKLKGVFGAGESENASRKAGNKYAELKELIKRYPNNFWKSVNYYLTADKIAPKHKFTVIKDKRTNAPIFALEGPKGSVIPMAKYTNICLKNKSLGTEDDLMHNAKEAVDSYLLRKDRDAKVEVK